MMVCLYLGISVVSDCKYTYIMHSHISHCITQEIFPLHPIYQKYSPAWFTHLMDRTLA